jgi:hypothetical protein
MGTSYSDKIHVLEEVISFLEGLRQERFLSAAKDNILKYADILSEICEDLGRLEDLEY